MDVFNKFYSSVSSTVSTTVSQLSTVLPGNPVTREFEATCHIASAGRGLTWKVYKGFKKSTKQEASIFVFEKRTLDTWPKHEREQMLTILRKGVMQLTKLRHPQILTVQHPLEESRESLAFATEPVLASLANVLKRYDNMPKPIPETISTYKLLELEIKYGILQIGEGLAFLHNDVKLLHKNISPESIVINSQGAWKIFGFDFCVLNENVADAKPSWPFTEFDPHLKSAHLQPSLEYTAPECIISRTHFTASDMYSFGMLIYVLYSPNNRPLFGHDVDYYDFKRLQSQVDSLKQSLDVIPGDLRQYVKLLLNETPQLRPDAHQFIKIPFFDDIGVKTLNYLDSLFQWDNLQKSKFYKGLPEIIKQLPHRVCLNRIVPCLIKEFINPPMIPFVLPNILLIAENSTNDEYCKHILPHLKPIMKLHEPIQILLIFMQKLDFLLKLTPAGEVKSDILPMLYRALETDAQQIQELCLSILPNFAGLIDFPSMKNAVLPRIKRLCLGTNYISVRVNCLLCIGNLLEHLDKWLVMDDILPFLREIPSREPAVLMAILGIYKLAATHKKLGLTKECVATKVLPFLIPLCIENGLTLPQFNAMITLVKDMVNQVETEHRIKLEQLNSIKSEQKALDSQLESSINSLNISGKTSNSPGVDDIFSNLGLDSYVNNAASGPFDSRGDNLSIQDKQRIVNEKELSLRLSDEKPIAPIPPISLSKNTQKKPIANDLTSSLLQSNLNQLNQLNKTSTPFLTQTSPAIGNGASNWPMATSSMNSWNSSIASPVSNWPNGGQVNPPTNQTGWSNVNQLSNNNNWTRMSNQATSPMSPNWSNQNNWNGNTNSNLLSPSGPNTTTTTKPTVLSQNDILEFLK